MLLRQEVRDSWPYSLIVMAVTLRSNENVTFQCAFHVVWCPKYRRSVLGLEDGAIERRLKEIVIEVLAEHPAWLIEMEVMPDHVHLLLECDPQYGLHKVVKAIKGRSSRVLRSEFPVLKRRLPTLWTNAYFAATVGGAPLDVVKRYVEQQKNR
jgi:putative transposase